LDLINFQSFREGKETSLFHDHLASGEQTYFVKCFWKRLYYSSS